ncbi:MAG: hypothetical protein CMJ68_11150 [Planctomycetaceae bacterium]|nr:hypothetical protein [Planctomycetaceae bacterium]
MIFVNSSIQVSFFSAAEAASPPIFLKVPSSLLFSPSIPSVSAPVPLLQPNGASTITMTNRIQNL